MSFTVGRDRVTEVVVAVVVVGVLLGVTIGTLINSKITVDKLSTLSDDVAALKADVGKLKTSTEELKTEMGGLRTNMGSLAVAVLALSESSSILLERLTAHDNVIQNRMTQTERLVVNGNRLTVNLRSNLLDEKGFLLPHLSGRIIGKIEDLEEGAELRCLFGVGTSDGFFIIPFTEVGGVNTLDQPQFLCKTPGEAKFVYVLPDDIPDTALIVNLEYMKFPLESILGVQEDLN